MAEQILFTHSEEVPEYELIVTNEGIKANKERVGWEDMIKIVAQVQDQNNKSLVFIDKKEGDPVKFTGENFDYQGFVSSLVRLDKQNLLFPYHEEDEPKIKDMVEEAKKN